MNIDEAIAVIRDRVSMWTKGGTRQVNFPLMQAGEALVDQLRLRPASEWTEEDGDVLWYRATSMQTPPIVSCPDEETEGWFGHYTHWQPLPHVTTANHHAAFDSLPLLKEPKP